VAGRPHSAARGDATRPSGIVRDVRNLVGAAGMLLEFRIERHDASGDRLAPVAAQMRGLSFSGSVNNGDEVRVNRARWRDGTLRVKDLNNLSTGAVVRAQQNTVGSWLIGAFVLVLFVVVLGALAFAFVNFVVLGNDQLPWGP
jgi:hypothetical protein